MDLSALNEGVRELILPIVLALISGAGFAKLIEAFANRSKNAVDVSANERSNLRHDIAYLRQEITNLRTRVTFLEGELELRLAENVLLRRAFWRLKYRGDRLVEYLSSTTLLDDDLQLAGFVATLRDVELPDELEHDADENPRPPGRVDGRQE